MRVSQADTERESIMANFIRRFATGSAVLGISLAGGLAELHAQMQMRPHMSGPQMQQPFNNSAFMGRQMIFSPFSAFGGNMMNSFPGYGGMMYRPGYGSGGYGAGYGGMGYGGMSGGYGGMGYGDYGNNSGYNSMQSYPEESAATYGSSAASRSSTESRPNAVLSAMGLRNQDGKLTWPLGIEALRPVTEVKPLQEQIDGVIQIVANGRASESNPGLVDQAKKSCTHLRSLLRSHGRDHFDASTYREAMHFLDQLDDGLKLMQ